MASSTIAIQAYITVTTHLSHLTGIYCPSYNVFPENHKAESILEKVKEILANFCMSCSSVVADQSSNMEAFSHQMKAEFGCQGSSTNSAMLKMTN